MRNNREVHLGEGVVEHTTAKAYLFSGFFLDKPIWVPKSQSVWELEGTDEAGNARGVMYVSNWYAKKEGLSDV